MHVVKARTLEAKSKAKDMIFFLEANAYLRGVHHWLKCWDNYQLVSYECGIP